MKPLLFLDVDGVLNCLGGGHLARDVGGIPCEVPAGLSERVGRLLPAFEPVWATAWQGTAHRAWRDVLDLPESSWPYIQFADLKLPEILRYAKERPWAWVDDDADWELSRLGWTRSMVAGRIINPSARVGLTDRHVSSLLAFASRSSEGAVV